MGMLQEFKDFAMRGNVVDMAVGIIIGGAFGKIVSSLVNDVVMPPIGVLLGGVDFSNLKYQIKEGVPADAAAGTEAVAAVTINYGVFFNTVIDFVIIAFAIFLVVKLINRARKLTEKQAEAKAPTTKDCPQCCTSIPLAANRCPNCTSELKPA